MSDLNSYLVQAEKVAEVIDALMLDDMHLAAPHAYQLSGRGERVYLIGWYNPLMMGRSLKVYEHPEVARRLRMALNLPVTITKETGTRYVVLLHGQVGLPKVIDYPGSDGPCDIFRLGMGLGGEVKLKASRMLNALIGAGQGAGKSTLLKLLVIQMQSWDWKLYLADPQYHTFNPDVWTPQRARGVAMSVAGSHQDMLHMVDALEGELANRQASFRAAAATAHKIPDDVDEFNRLAPVHGQGLMPRIGLIGDEFNFFLSHKGIFTRMVELLRAGRKWGLHIIMAGHEWHKDTVPAQVNDLAPTRIALRSLSGAVVLRNNQWGKWVEGRGPGRGVLRTTRFEPMQFYRVESGEWKVDGAEAPEAVSPIPAREAELVRRSIADANGKMTKMLLMEWGLSEREARDLGDRYEIRGWLAKDPLRDNARCITDELLAILGESRPNAQTVQTVQTFLDDVQTGVQTLSKPVQTDVQTRPNHNLEI